LSNTTFRRHYPAITRSITEYRHAPQHDPTNQPGASRYDRLVERNARLRRANRDLTDFLRLAAAQIQRLTLQNDQLRQQLESANKATRIDSVRPRQSREHQST